MALVPITPQILKDTGRVATTPLNNDDLFVVWQDGAMVVVESGDIGGGQDFGVVTKVEDFVDFNAVTPTTNPDTYVVIAASLITAANLNWAGAVRVQNVASGGYVRYFPIIDGIANTAFTFDLTKGKLSLATVTYVPNTTPAPSLTGSNDRAYVMAGIYRDQVEDGNFITSRAIASVIWNRNSPNFQLFANDGALIVDTGVVALQNTEYHIEVALNGTECKVYINRVLVVTTAIVLPVNTSVVAAIGAGAQAFGGGQSTGGIDIWIDWYGLRYTPNVTRAVGFNDGD